MTKSKFYLITLLTAILLSVVLGSSSAFASDFTYSTNQAETTITIPLIQWNELKSNNEKALSLIETSSLPLTEAQSLVMKQREELNKSARYNIDIGNRINESQNALNEARSYLVRNVELYRRIEEQSRERPENNPSTQDATQPIPNTGSGCDNRSSNSSMTER